MKTIREKMYISKSGKKFSKTKIEESIKYWQRVLESISDDAHELDSKAMRISDLTALIQRLGVSDSTPVYGVTNDYANHGLFGISKVSDKVLGLWFVEEANIEELVPENPNPQQQVRAWSLVRRTGDFWGDSRTRSNPILAQHLIGANYMKVSSLLKSLDELVQKKGFTHIIAVQCHIFDDQSDIAAFTITGCKMHEEDMHGRTVCAITYDNEQDFNAVSSQLANGGI